jgi:hypothetical protein
VSQPGGSGNERGFRNPIVNPFALPIHENSEDDPFPFPRHDPEDDSDEQINYQNQIDVDD